MRVVPHHPLLASDAEMGLAALPGRGVHAAVGLIGPDATAHSRSAGEVAPAVAWDRYAVLAEWSTWAPFIFGVDASGSLLAAGLTGIVRGPVGLRVVFVVDEVNRAGAELAVDRT